MITKQDSTSQAKKHRDKEGHLQKRGDGRLQWVDSLFPHEFLIFKEFINQNLCRFAHLQLFLGPVNLIHVVPLTGRSEFFLLS